MKDIENELPDFPMWISLNGWEFDIEHGDWLNVEKGAFSDNMALYGNYIKWRINEIKKLK